MLFFFFNYYQVKISWMCYNSFFLNRNLTFPSFLEESYKETITPWVLLFYFYMFQIPSLFQFSRIFCNFLFSCMLQLSDYYIQHVLHWPLEERIKGKREEGREREREGEQRHLIRMSWKLGVRQKRKNEAKWEMFYQQ